MSRTVLITGVTGYLGRHVARVFLDHGYRVIGSTRDAGRLNELKRDIRPALEHAESIGALRLVELDLTSDDGWDRAMEGVDALIHTASPFPLSEPSDPQELIGPAVEGARRALEAAARAGVRDVVLTSSVVAVTENGKHDHTYSEDDWSDPDWDGITTYARSKTLAEKAAWELAETHGLNLATINPGLITGPALGRGYGTSVEVIERLLKGKDPMLARIGFAVVDVGDVALAHLRALENDAAKGHRHILADRFFWISEAADAIRHAVPAAKTPKRVAPNLLIRGLAMFDASIRGILPNLDRGFAIDNTRLREVLKITPRDGADSIRETALWLRNKGLA